MASTPSKACGRPVERRGDRQCRDANGTRLAPSLLISDDEVAEATRRISAVMLAANRAEVD